MFLREVVRFCCGELLGLYCTHLGLRFSDHRSGIFGQGYWRRIAVCPLSALITPSWLVVQDCSTHNGGVYVTDGAIGGDSTAVLAVTAEEKYGTLAVVTHSPISQEQMCRRREVDQHTQWKRHSW